MNRTEHLQYCKDRALEYVDAGDLENAWASIVSDLRKHKETESHSALLLGTMLMVGGYLSTPQEMREFIEGLN